MTTDEERAALDRAARDVTRRLNEYIAETTREPRWRHFALGQWKYGWTTEAVDGLYQSFIWMPQGKGARDRRGGWRAESWVIRRIVNHRTRRAAKARAYRLYETDRAKVAART